MRRSLVELLRTPITGQALHLEVFATRERNFVDGWANCSHYCSLLNRIPSGREPCQICGLEEVIDGRLVSEDGNEQYPVIHGIPRLLPQQYMVQVWQRYPQWLQRHGTVCHSALSPYTDKKIEIQQRTAKKFGQEWQTFDKLLRDFNEVFHRYFDLVDLRSLDGKSVLDAGCGMGRWAFHLAPNAKRVVALDLSFAVEPAYKNCYEQGNVEVIHADIFHLPLRSLSFDLIYCLGVLHHLPDPLAGILSLKKLISNGGQLLTYMYYNLENRPTYFKAVKKAVDLLRNFTTRAPASCSYAVAFALAVGIYLPLVWYGGVLSSMGLRDVGRKIPLYQTYSGKSFRLIYNDAVDRVTAPIENRYSKAEIAGLFSKAGFRGVKFSRTSPYWKACGQLNKF